LGKKKRLTRTSDQEKLWSPIFSLNVSEFDMSGAIYISFTRLNVQTALVRAGVGFFFAVNAQFRYLSVWARGSRVYCDSVVALI
jgi:hypothetical protein